MVRTHIHLINWVLSLVVKHLGLFSLIIHGIPKMLIINYFRVSCATDTPIEFRIIHTCIVLRLLVGMLYHSSALPDIPTVKDTLAAIRGENRIFLHPFEFFHESRMAV